MHTFEYVLSNSKSMDSSTVARVTPCADNDLHRLCSEYSAGLPCCDGVRPGSSRFKEGDKLLRGRADCADLFGLREELLKTNQFKFRTVSWCMFPVMKKGDLLRVEPVSIEDIRIGDIPVYRSNDRLYAHRIVDKKVIDGKAYIITRPDEAGDVGDNKNGEKIAEEEILGVIREIKRGRKTLSTERRKASSWERFLYKKAMLYSHLKNLLIKIVTKLQTFRPYQMLGRILTAGIMPYLNFELALPFSNKILSQVYNYTPLEDNEKIDFSRLKKTRLFHLVMKFNNAIIGYASFLRRPQRCPYPGLRIAEVHIRLRYGKLGFEPILLKKAETLLRDGS